VVQSDERRKHDRVTISIAVQYEDHAETVLVHSRDISLGGLFLGTITPAAPGTDLALVVQLPDPHGSIHANGRVVHCLQGIGMGVEFSDFPGDSEHRLRDYLASAAS
jgi:uncharacterized protein (TIGR02266 family)